MGAQSFHGLPGYLERLSRASMDLVSEKMADQEWNIVTTFAEAWEVNGNNIEPIVEVFPESAVLDSFFERFVARRDNADVYVNRDVVARSEEHTSELQSPCNLVCRLLLEKKKTPPAAHIGSYDHRR